MDTLINQYVKFSSFLKHRLLIIFFSGLLILLQSCLSLDKVTQITRQRVQEIDSVKNFYNPSYLTLSTDSLPRQDSLIKVRELPPEFVPLLFYWKDKRDFECVLRPEVPVQIFRQEFARLADSLNLSSRLQGQRLELSLLECPSAFIYSHKTEVVFLLIAAITKEEDLVIPKDGRFRLTYRFWEENVLKDQGEVNLPFINVKEGRKFQSKSAFIRAYLLYYRQYYRWAARIALKRVTKSLPNRG